MQTEIFEKAVRDSKAYIYSLSYRLTGSSDDARDLAQETYLKALQKWGSVKNRENPLPWLRRICVNAFIDSSRKKSGKPGMIAADFPAEGIELVADTPTPEDEIVITEDVRAIQSQCYTVLTSLLRPLQRIAFVLVDIFRIDIREVSRLIGKSLPATKSLLYRARRRMNGYLVPHCGLVAPEKICKCAAWKEFTHDVGKKREMLKTILAGGTNINIETGSKKTLRLLYNQLPYLIPPKKL